MNRLFRAGGASQNSIRRMKRGVSTLQLAGCVAAIGAGILVGASFLDVDLKAAWQMGLERAGVVEPRERSAQSGSAEATSPAGENAENPQDETTAGDGSSLGTKGKATLAYWGQLRDAIQQEQTTRGNRELQSGGDTRSILQARITAFQGAADTIDGIASEGVDPDVASLAVDLADWYRRGAELSEEGTLLDDADLSGNGGPLGRRWHSAQRQHREQLDLLTRKTSSLQAKLSVRYRTKFPDLR